MTEQATAEIRTVNVPGATLYVEVRDSGPVLCITSGPTDAGTDSDLAARLADRYTVGGYDRRGSRSALEGDPEDIPVSLHASDASAILASVGDEPAYGYRNSGRGTIGLELSASRPRVRASNLRGAQPLRSPSGSAPGSAIFQGPMAVGGGTRRSSGTGSTRLFGTPDLMRRELTGKCECGAVRDSKLQTQLYVNRQAALLTERCSRPCRR